MSSDYDLKIINLDVALQEIYLFLLDILHKLGQFSKRRLSAIYLLT